MTDGLFFHHRRCDTAVSMAVGATLADCLKINQDAI
jgi:hypothetical protein